MPRPTHHRGFLHLPPARFRSPGTTASFLRNPANWFSPVDPGTQIPSRYEGGRPRPRRSRARTLPGVGPVTTGIPLQRFRSPCGRAVAIATTGKSPGAARNLRRECVAFESGRYTPGSPDPRRTMRPTPMERTVRNFEEAERVPSSLRCRRLRLPDASFSPTEPPLGRCAGQRP